MLRLNAKTLLLLKAFLCIWFLGFGQNQHKKDLTSIDKLMKNEEFNIAKAIANKKIDSLISENSFYQLTDYAYYLGRIEFKINGKSSAIKTVNDLTENIYNKTTNLKVLRQLALETGSFYESINDSETARQFNIKALELTKQMPNAKGQDLALVQSNLGVYSSRLGDIATAARYHQDALESLNSDSEADPDSYYISYNSLGAMMWYSSKFDSAVYYYKKAEKVLKTLEQTPWNKYYRAASLNNNIGGIYSIQGDMDGSLMAMQNTVKYLNSFLKEDISETRRNHASQFLFQAIDNYGGLYKDMGDYKKAKQLLMLSYRQKRDFFDSDSPEIAKSLVLLGQIESSLHNYNSAEQYLDEGIASFKANPGDYTYWLGDAYYHKAMLKNLVRHRDSTKFYLALAKTNYEISLGDYYDEVYLDFIINSSNFYALYGDADLALNMAESALTYIRKNQGRKTLLEYYQLLNLADINYKLENYEESLGYTDQAINLLNSNELAKNSKLNKLQVESNKISAILLKIKTLFNLSSNNDEAELNRQLELIDEGLVLLERKKSILSSESSTAILIQDNVELFKIAKRICLNLFEITNDISYMEKLLAYHESMVYHKIRTRLNSKSANLTAKLPAEVIEKESQLKSKLNSALSEDRDFNAFVTKEKEWNSFLRELKQEYPDYYDLRYASIIEDLGNITSKIPKNTTIVRYIYLEDNLLALIITESDIKVYQLADKTISDDIFILNKKLETLQPPFKTLHKLYSALWQPFENDLNTENIVIIPDENLFNLSFELLTAEKCNTNTELVNTSLLSKYLISYNYSFHLLEKDSQPIGYDSNFIAFAPEFSDDMKTEYKIGIKDSINLDYSYLKLLPQPFAKELANQYSRIFDGSSFLNEKASKAVFTAKAKEHKIIHIGTHAESDNVSPEFSRLIFAKENPDDNNSLYTYEIYNQDLSSNLAILTACETGKPTYQPGEGMISLAHAFNYAGSESILTSLWKIDEKSSAQIIEYFYDYLNNGLPKDKALQQAKLKYISTSQGRTLAPQYWAGLVLIGDVSPIEINSSNQLYWLLGLLIVIIVFAGIRLINR
ncbi:CHAT domain-containing protein [Winogradskyella sp. DF17]|uniref:CHAT domain-containing protein n=1 Tax=Winogradskyella pelagia TaxID=2819984 RepID=A0ABS3T4R8_9FLAO|nr:CHAT domain-containing tetratricopeptide repeat protein [Winogradskyella sp. DF17]MBO3117743.1 CHAT domain-containing protein [Winogradskyella sp. DF17]